MASRSPSITSTLPRGRRRTSWNRSMRRSPVRAQSNWRLRSRSASTMSRATSSSWSNAQAWSAARLTSNPSRVGMSLGRVSSMLPCRVVKTGTPWSAASNGARPDPPTTDGYSTRAAWPKSHCFSGSVIEARVCTSARSPGRPSKNSASRASELPLSGVGPARTMGLRQPRCRSSAHTSRANRRFSCRYEAPRQRRKPSTSANSDAGRCSASSESGPEIPHDTTADGFVSSIRPSASAARRL